jgi:hypothetical protein
MTGRFLMEELKVSLSYRAHVAIAAIGDLTTAK